MKTIITYAFRTDRTYLIPFEYLTRRFIKVYLVGPTSKRELVMGVDFRFLDKTNIQTVVQWPGSEPWQNIEIRRVTSATDRLVDFNDGSILRASELNISQIQALHIAEESRDSAADNLGVDRNGNYDARNRRIVNLAAGVEDRDAVNMEQIRDLRATMGASWRFLMPTWGATTGQPATRDNGDNLQWGDQWMDSSTGITYYWKDQWIPVNIDTVSLGMPGGAAMIGVEFGSRNIPIKTVADYIAASTMNIWLFAYAVTERPEPLNPGTWDWTPAFQIAADLGGAVYCPATQYTLKHVFIRKSLKITFEPGSRVKQKDGSIGFKGFWSRGNAPFEVETAGVVFEIDGELVFDANANGQPEKKEPNGMFVKVWNDSPDDSSRYGMVTSVIIRNVTGINGTYGWVLARGDDVRRRWRTDVHLDNCKFNATLYGAAKGDPNTPTPLGWSPTYVHIQDYVVLTTMNFQCTFDKPITTPYQYAPTGVLGTYNGRETEESGQCQIHMMGVTYARGMGRGGPAPDGTWTNNGIGVFDVYGNGEYFRIDRLVAEDCHVQVMRAKASLKEFTLGSARLTRCRGGIQVSPSSTGPARSIVSIQNVVSIDGTVPVVEVSGTSWDDAIPEAKIDNVYSLNADNRNSLPRPASVYLGQTRQISVTNIRVMSPQVGSGIEMVDCEQIRIENITAQNVPLIGILARGKASSLVVDGASIRNVAGGAGINIQLENARLRFVNVECVNTKDYAILINTASTRQAEIIGCYAENIAGISRGFYSAAGFDRLEGCKIGAGVTTPWVAAVGKRAVLLNNSWQPYMGFGGAAAPTVGTFKRGDILMNQFPVAGGPKGFRCISDGTPGTWEQI